MGEALSAYFSRAEKVGGIQAKVRLAELTQIPSTVASVTADTPDLIARFDAAMREVIDELGGLEGHLDASAPSSHWGSCLRFLIHREQYIRSREETAREVTSLLTNIVRPRRASVWYLVGDGELECVDAFDAVERRHESGERIEASAHLEYFDEGQRDQTIAASDARSDSRTGSLSEGHLIPHRLEAMLDAPIWSLGRLLGVVSCEHDSVRSWSREEREYVLFGSQVVALGEELRAGAYASRSGE